MKARLCFAGILALILGIATLLMAQENEGDVLSPAHASYKVLRRNDIDILGGKTNEEKVLNTETDLANGLNKLAKDGWELIAIEQGRTHPITGGSMNHPPTYIFRRIQ